VDRLVADRYAVREATRSIPTVAPPIPSVRSPDQTGDGRAWTVGLVRITEFGRRGTPRFSGKPFALDPEEHQ